MSCLTERTGFRIVILPIWRPKATLKVGWSRYIRCMICEQIDGYTYQSIDFGFLFVELSDYLSLLYCTAVSHFFAYTHTHLQSRLTSSTLDLVLYSRRHATPVTPFLCLFHILCTIATWRSWPQWWVQDTSVILSFGNCLVGGFDDHLQCPLLQIYKILTQDKWTQLTSKTGTLCDQNHHYFASTCIDELEDFMGPGTTVVMRRPLMFWCRFLDLHTTWLFHKTSQRWLIDRCTVGVGAVFSYILACSSLEINQTWRSKIERT